MITIITKIIVMTTKPKNNDNKWTRRDKKYTGLE